MSDAAVTGDNDPDWIEVSYDGAGVRIEIKNCGAPPVAMTISCGRARTLADLIRQCANQRS